MGYRTYIGSLPKEEHDKIKGMELQELFAHMGEEWGDGEDERGYISTGDIAADELYQLGKYVDEFDPSLFSQVFEKEETQRYFSEEQDFHLVGKEFLEAVIKMYRDKIRENYKNILAPFFDEGGHAKAPFLKSRDNPIMNDAEISGIYDALHQVKSMAQEWGIATWGQMDDGDVPYRLDRGDEITTSWKYEYVMFELVRIYKTFDWENNIMIYHGH